MELTRYQKVILAVLGGMLVLFGALMWWFRAHPGVEFEEGLLKISGNEERTLYTGKVHGTPVSISVARRPEDPAQVDVTYDIPGVTSDCYQIRYPLAPIKTEYGEAAGIEIRKNGDMVFQGGYDPEEPSGWYDQDGQWTPQIGVRFSVEGADPWYGYETSVYEAFSFAFSPGSAARGDPLLFASALIISIITAAEVLFCRELFHWRHWGARDPEPTEEYMALERVLWAVMAGVAAVLYIAAMTKIY